MKCWVALLALVLFALSETQKTAAHNTVLCYYSSWATYREGKGKFEIEHIDPFLCTHVLYAFINFAEDGSIVINDPWGDIDLGGFRRFNELRQQNPHLKTLIAVGGWDDGHGSPKWSRVVANTHTRSNLVNNLYNFVKEWNFSGLDLDWEFPARLGGVPDDKVNFVHLLRELHTKFHPEGLVLTTAVSASVADLTTSYDVPEVVKYVDFVNLMTYDFHGSYDGKTGINSPMYPASIDTDHTINADAAVQSWLNHGAPANKLLLGAPMYGRSFTLQDPNSPGLGAEASSDGKPGPFLRQTGALGFNEICEMVYPGGYSLNWAAQQLAPFAFRGDQWVGFDNVESVTHKAEYARTHGLGGMLVWSIDTDDYFNICGQGSMPLTSTIKRILNS